MRPAIWHSKGSNPKMSWFDGQKKSSLKKMAAPLFIPLLRVFPRNFPPILSFGWPPRHFGFQNFLKRFPASFLPAFFDFLFSREWKSQIFLGIVGRPDSPPSTSYPTADASIQHDFLPGPIRWLLSSIPPGKSHRYHMPFRASFVYFAIQQADDNSTQRPLDKTVGLHCPSSSVVASHDYIDVLRLERLVPLSMWSCCHSIPKDIRLFQPERRSTRHSIWCHITVGYTHKLHFPTIEGSPNVGTSRGYVCDCFLDGWRILWIWHPDWLLLCTILLRRHRIQLHLPQLCWCLSSKVRTLPRLDELKTRGTEKCYKPCEWCRASVVCPFLFGIAWSVLSVRFILLGHSRPTQGIWQPAWRRADMDRIFPHKYDSLICLPTGILGATDSKSYDEGGARRWRWCLSKNPWERDEERLVVG